jgi:hypothetical protein
MNTEDTEGDNVQALIRSDNRIFVTVAALMLAIEIAIFGGLHMVSAHGSHWGGQNPGEWGNHAGNPAHMWVQVFASGGPQVSGGGRYHTACNAGTGTCSPGLYGDQALDIAAGGNTPSYLTATYGGYAPNGSEWPNNNINIAVWTYAQPVGYFASSPGQPACEVRLFETYLEYWDTTGAYRFRNIGGVFIGHNTSWQQATGWIAPNAWTPNPNGGTGWVNYLNQLWVSNVYNGSSPPGLCSPTGPHTHMEFVSWHEMGSFFEWWGWGLDHHPYPGAHLHSSTDYIPPRGVNVGDAISANHTVGWLGGYAYTYWVTDNGYEPGH